MASCHLQKPGRLSYLPATLNPKAAIRIGRASLEPCFWEGLGVYPEACRSPVNALSESIVVLARSEDGVEFAGQTPGLVNLLFLLITPAEQPDAQMVLLSEIASIAGNADERRRLNEVTSASEVAEILTMT
jgi:hypothetical protein